MSYYTNHYLIMAHTLGCGQTFWLFWPGANYGTPGPSRAGDEGFPTHILKAFPLGTKGWILAIILVHHKSLLFSP